MSQLNTLALQEALLKRTTDFALDDHFVRDEELWKTLQKLWTSRPELGGLGSDLWVEGAFPSTPAAETMQNLVERGLVHQSLAQQLHQSGAFSLHLKPYQHQLQSIEAAASRDYPGDGRPAIVVTAGTGAGKTESFLIPMLNELWSRPAEAGEGVSALILYPMNALVNDQVTRLDRWLAGQDRLSFFHFTSETPENAKIANDRNLRPATPARFRTRQQARGWEDANGETRKNGDGPTPDILVTNYSMLEYMLCRPQDAVFFGSNLRVIVLDEAHIYSGNLAAEITLLLRRVMMRCGRPPEQVLCIATSATIGGGPEELQPFAAKLFSKPEELVRVIAGKPFKPLFASQPATLPLSSDLKNVLYEKPFPAEETLVAEDGEPAFRGVSGESWAQWAEALAVLVPENAHQRAVERFSERRQPAPLLAAALTESGVLAALQELLWNGGCPSRRPLPELAHALFACRDSEALEATRQLLQAGAVARISPNALPLLPNRIHYLLRGPEGVLIAFSNASAEGMLPVSQGRFIFSAGADPSTLGDSAQHPLTLFRCPESGWWGAAGVKSGGALEPVPASLVLYGEDEARESDPENPNPSQNNRVQFYSLEEVAGAPCIRFEPSTGRYGGVGPIPLWEVNACPVSGVPLTPESVGWFSSRARLQLSVVAETALAAMPEYPQENKAWKPARGRRLLVFSDSRAEAARLGPRLTRQHELQVFRAAVVERLDSMAVAGTAEDRAQLLEDIRDLREQMESASPARRATLQRRLAQAEEEMQQAAAGGSVTAWAQELRNSEIIKELYDPAEGKNHQPGDAHAYDAWIRNERKILAQLQPLLGRELARRPAWPNPSLETLGLVEVTYSGIEDVAVPDALLGVLPAALSNGLEAAWPDYLAALLDSVRNQGAVTLGGFDEDRDYQYGNELLGKFFSAEHPYRRSMIPLIGAHFDRTRASRRNRFTKGVLIALGLSEEEAQLHTRELMQAAFQALANLAQSGKVPWLKYFASKPTNADTAVQALQLHFPALGLRRPSVLYRCEQTGQVWPRSVAGLYPGAIEPCLQLVHHDELDKDPRLGRRRRELAEWPGFKLALWAEEHSAQLSPDENARLQNLFREGMRNILSSTTTLELGIDIGGLSAVLLGNLPPGKANYLQRAGRAGRRSDGTSAVLGFARPTAYEREVFLDFRRYLERDLRRPTIFLDRPALARRHAHAWLLGEFFQQHFAEAEATGAMDAYGRMGPFTGQPLPDFWKSGESKPTRSQPNPNPVSGQFLEFLEELIDTPRPEMQHTLRRLWEGCAHLDPSDSAWVKNLREIRAEFQKAISAWKDLTVELTNAWAEVPEEPSSGPSRAQANAIRFQLLALHKLTVIESLADASVLPRYGFPIGMSRLRVQAPESTPRDGKAPASREEDQFRLQRDSMMAMREYAPGSQLLVGGKVVTSRGLLKHWTGAVMGNESWGLRGRFVRTKSGYFHYDLSGATPQPPPQERSSADQEGVFLFPRHGFTTAAWDPPRLGSEFERIGKVEVFTLAFAHSDECDPPQCNFGGLRGCIATYRHAGELFLLHSGANERGFAICQKCGYAESEWHRKGAGRVDLPGRFEWHPPLNSAKDTVRCWGSDEAPVWRNHHLAAKQTTHLLRLDFAGTALQNERAVLYTLGQALRLTAAQLLELDEREIGALDPAPDPSTGQFRFITLYDSLAGGAGHLAELSQPLQPERARQWIQRTVDLLTVDEQLPEAVRRREGIRRLLTSACDASLLEPERARAFLVGALGGDVSPQTPVSPMESAHPVAWTLDRLLIEEPPEEFEYHIPANLLTGVPAGPRVFRQWNASPSEGFPQANAVVLARVPGSPPRVVIGRWFHSNVSGAKPHRIRLRQAIAPLTIELTEEEFRSLRIIAIANS